MREIKFRGRCKQCGDMVIGNLIHGGGKAGKIYILPIKHSLAHVKHCDPLDGVEVDPKTIGQYTGPKDKNGTEIYEGDIFGENNRLLESGVETIGIIVYDDDLGSFVIHKENGGFEYLGKFLLEEKRAEIVGNIYENPELLNNGQEDKRSVASKAK